MLSAVYAVIVYVRVCLSVCLSVTLRYCIKTAKRRITQIMPHDRSGTLVYTDKRVARPSAMAELLVCCCCDQESFTL